MDVLDGSVALSDALANATNDPRTLAPYLGTAEGIAEFADLGKIARQLNVVAPVTVISRRPETTTGPEGFASS